MKKLSLALVIIMGLILIGFGIYQITGKGSGEELTADEIKELVSKEYPGEIVKLEYEKDDGEGIYEVEVIDADVKYEIELLAATGEIIKSSEEKLKLESTNRKIEDRSGHKPSHKKSESQRTRAVYDPEKMCQAVEKADESYGGQVVEVEYETHSGESVYDVKLKDETKLSIITYNSELEVVNERDKAIKSHKYEDAKVSFCEVINLATDEAQGMIEEVDLDHENGKLVYEIKVENGNKETDLVIDAMTKEIISLERDD